jgi:outer membrane protein assembly factor BamA
MDLRARIAHRHWTLIAALATAVVVVSRPAVGQSQADRVPPPVTLFGSIPEPEVLEAEGAVIGEISIVIGDVFDTRIKGERSWLYRTANKLHIETRESTVRDQLLFKPGEPYRERLIEETERLLRENDYLYSAEIVPVAYRNGVVDLEVRTRDVWTLNPGFSYSRAGGENDVGAQIEEKNLFGTGQQIGIAWGDDVDREAIRFDFYDPHFGDGFTQFGLMFADATDGETSALRLERPFFSLDTRRAGGARLFDGRLNQPRYQLGDEIGEFEHRSEHHELHFGLSDGLTGRWVRRYTAGVTYDHDKFALLPGVDPGGPLPEDRELLYPWVGVELIEDRYEERHNQDQIGRTEDVLLGVRLGARLGYASDSLGSDRDAWVARFWAQDGVDLAPGHTVFGLLGASGRLEDGSLVNGLLEAEARYYWQTTEKSKFYLDLSGAVARDLDAEHQLLLGGDNGLRGYPLRYQAGTSRALLTLEQRYYTDWYPFHLFYVGAAAFFDVGRTWGTDVTGLESSGWLRDVGIGLRLGSSRSSFGNVIHIDLAFPLDGDDDIDEVQLLVKTKARF